MALTDDHPAGVVWLLVLAAVLAYCVAVAVAERRYHVVPLEKLATTRWTHVCVTGPVVYVRKMRDGDVHVTLDNGKAKVVLEIIPAIPLPRPKKGRRIEACGISRTDRHHGWAEVHPVERWREVQ